MQALITGSNGFIGSHLVEHLLEKSFQVKCLIRKTSNIQWLKNLPVQFVYGDVTDADSLQNAVEQVDYVFHLGGAVRVKHENDFIRINVDGTKNLLNACEKHNPKLKRFVYVSSQAAVGPSKSGIPLTERDTPQPISRYGNSKRLAEKLVLKYGKIFPVTIISPPSVYGPRDDDILTIFKYIKFGVKPLVGKKAKKVSLIHVRDLAQAIAIAAEHKKAANELFFISNKEAYDWAELENVISITMDKKSIFIFLPEWLVDVMAFLSEQLAKLFGKAAVLNRDKALEMKQQYWLIDGAKAEKLLGFTPKIILKNGLKETYRWYINQGWL